MHTPSVNWTLDSTFNWSRSYEDLNLAIPDGMLALAITDDGGNKYTVRHAEYWVNGMDDDGDGIRVENENDLIPLGVDINVVQNTITSVLGR